MNYCCKLVSWERKMIRYVNYLWNCCCMLETYKCYHPLSMLLILSVVNVLTQVIYVTTITTPVPSSTCIAIDDAILVICFILATSYEVTTILIIAIISLATNTTLVVINCLIIMRTMVLLSLLSCWLPVCSVAAFISGLTGSAHTDFICFHYWGWFPAWPVWYCWTPYVWLFFLFFCFWP